MNRHDSPCVFNDLDFLTSVRWLSHKGARLLWLGTGHKLGRFWGAILTVTYTQTITFSSLTGPHGGSGPHGRNQDHPRHHLLRCSPLQVCRSVSWHAKGVSASCELRPLHNTLIQWGRNIYAEQLFGDVKRHHSCEGISGPLSPWFISLHALHLP